MIESLHIYNFKCFENERFDLCRMNVLCGQNGVGKSSLIQAMLLMRQASIQNSNSIKPNIVKLNGPFLLELGQVVDILNYNATCQNNSNFIEFALTYDNQKNCKFRFNADNKIIEDHFLSMEEDNLLTCPSYLTSEETGLFTYLCAERNGPRDIQKIQSSSGKAIQVGVQGEFVAEVLVNLERNHVRAGLLFPLSKGQTVRKQVQFWMQDLMSAISGIEIESKALSNTNIVTIRMRKGGIKAEWQKPTNIGFGISYSLPIIVAGLIAPANSLFIVENPEAHLHPAAQSKIARFLATLAASGVQVIVETHSDHILNGIRLAAVDDHPLERSDVRIYNFYNNSEGIFQKVPIEITRKGSLSKWPKGFFDQTEQDLAAILKARGNNA